MTKVLHITSWYPNKENPFEAIWIKKQIDALSDHVEKQAVLHLQVKPSNKFMYINTLSEKNLLKKQVILGIPTKKWIPIELINFLILFWFLRLKKIQKGYDIINFHIAYPQLVYWKWLKKGIKQKVVISEHWSAYHFGFGLDKKIPKIQNIFSHNIPVLTVSKALADDIENYSGYKITNFVIPNIIDNSIFYEAPSTLRENYFFMVSQWKKPKKPLIAIEAFHEFNQKHPNFKLKIGGFGPQMNEMKALVSQLNNTNIEFVGTLSSEEIAVHLQTCKAFLHPSDYETFSVVCAEARSCNTPIIASSTGGILEVVSENGLLIKENNISSWVKGMINIIEYNNTVNTENKYSSSSVGKQYFNTLNKV